MQSGLFVFEVISLYISRCTMPKPSRIFFVWAKNSLELVTVFRIVIIYQSLDELFQYKRLMHASCMISVLPLLIEHSIIIRLQKASTKVLSTSFNNHVCLITKAKTESSCIILYAVLQRNQLVTAPCLSLHSLCYVIVKQSASQQSNILFG